MKRDVSLFLSTIAVIISATSLTLSGFDHRSLRTLEKRRPYLDWSESMQMSWVPYAQSQETVAQVGTWIR